MSSKQNAHFLLCSGLIGESRRNEEAILFDLDYRVKPDNDIGRGGFRSSSIMTCWGVWGKPRNDGRGVVSLGCKKEKIVAIEKRIFYNSGIEILI